MIGAACAAELCAQGMQVLLLEAGHPGAGTTAAGMGHLVVMDDNPAELALSNWSCQLWRELVADDPAAHEYSQCGTLWVARDAEELQSARSKQSVLAAHGIASEVLDEQQLRQAEPELAAGLAGGLLVAQDGIVYPPKTVQILLQQAQATGRLQMQRAQVMALRAQGQGWHLSLHDGSSMQAGQVLLANGMQVKTLLPDLPLRAKKGHLAICERYPGFIRHQLVELAYIKNAHASNGDSVAFNAQPRPSGQVFLGSSRQYDQEGRELDGAILRQMLRACVDYLPGLKNLNLLRCWTGIRCASPDGLPLLGPHPAHPGLWLACGHEGLGITTALASAKLMAAQLAYTALPATAPAMPCRIADYLPARLLSDSSQARVA